MDWLNHSQTVVILKYLIGVDDCTHTTVTECGLYFKQLMLDPSTALLFDIIFLNNPMGPLHCSVLTELVQTLQCSGQN